MSLRPRALPKTRAQTLRRMNELDLTPEGNPFMRPGDDNISGLFLSHLRAADLYWISEDMTALAMHAGEQLTEARWATVDRPSAIGLAAFEGGLGMVQVAPGVESPVEALAWGPGPEETLIVWHLVNRDRLFGDVPQMKVDRMPPLLAVREARLPVTSQPIPLDDLPAHEGMPDAGVTLVALRRQHMPQDRDPDAGSDGRRYRHRWVVSGHWRTYRSERYSEQTRAAKQWIPSHVKGPDGAPLRSTEKVNVWRR